VLDYTRLGDRSACNCVVVAAQEILGIVKFGAGKPDGYFLECAFVEDLGFMLGERASKISSRKHLDWRFGVYDTEELP
jgi:hypothetical protein